MIFFDSPMLLAYWQHLIHVVTCVSTAISPCVAVHLSKKQTTSCH